MSAPENKPACERDPMARFGMTNFWAKTTSDGQPGISVRDHCLNVGCVAEAINILILD